MPSAHGQADRGIGRTRLPHRHSIGSPLVPHVGCVPLGRVLGLQPAPTALDREGHRPSRRQPEAALERADIAIVRLARVEPVPVGDEMEASRPGPAGPPRRERGEPREPRDREIRVADVPACRRLQEQRDEPLPVGREVAALRVDRRPDPRPCLELTSIGLPAREQAPRTGAAPDDRVRPGIASSDREDPWSQAALLPPGRGRRHRRRGGPVAGSRSIAPETPR